MPTASQVPLPIRSTHLPAFPHVPGYAATEVTSTFAVTPYSGPSHRAVKRATSQPMGQQPRTRLRINTHTSTYPDPWVTGRPPPILTSCTRATLSLSEPASARASGAAGTCAGRRVAALPHPLRVLTIPTAERRVPPPQCEALLHRFPSCSSSYV